MFWFKIYLLFSFGFYIKSNENFDQNINEFHEKSKYFSENNNNFDENWIKFYDLIETSKQDFKPNNKNQLKHKSCEYYIDFLSDELRGWNRSGISREVISETVGLKRGIHYQIIKHRLYRDNDCLFPSRCEGIQHFLKNAINWLPDMDLIINVRDYPQIPKNWHNLPVMSFSKDFTQYNDILYPGWTFWAGGPAIDLYPRGIGRWDLMRETITKNSIHWNNKSSIAFFRGSRTSGQRDPLIRFSRSNPHMVDAQYTKNQAWRSKDDTLGAEPAPTVSFEEHCKYKYLFNLRGVAASFRYKHLFLCKSLVLNVDSNWIEFFYPQLKPWVHFVPIAQDFSDLEEKLLFLRHNEEIAQNIAEKGFEFIWNELTLDSVQCYWNELLDRYSKLLKYKPQLNPNLIEIK